MFSQSPLEFAKILQKFAIGDFVVKVAQWKNGFSNSNLLYCDSLFIKPFFHCTGPPNSVMPEGEKLWGCQ